MKMPFTEFEKPMIESKNPQMQPTLDYLVAHHNCMLSNQFMNADNAAGSTPGVYSTVFTIIGDAEQMPSAKIAEIDTHPGGSNAQFVSVPVEFQELTTQ
jgi:hypothetical protein